MSKYTEYDAAYFQRKKSDPEYRARRAKNQRAYNDRKAACDYLAGLSYEGKHGVPYSKRGTKCFPGISTGLVESRTAYNWKRSGIVFDSQEEFDFWASKYNSATHCEISGLPFSSADRSKKCLDHDHSTGKPRGVISGASNLLLHSEQTEAILLKAVEYLRRTRLFN